jgi:MoaD family protein
VITVLIPSQLRAYADGHATVALAGDLATVGDVLDALARVHPGVRDRVMTETGEVRRHINVFVGDEMIRFTGDLATPVRDGDEVSILPAVSGG